MSISPVEPRKRRQAYIVARRDFKSVERQGKGKMTRLQKLHEERSVILMMQTLSYDLMEKCREWYDNEIEAIEKYNAPNPEMREKENKE